MIQHEYETEYEMVLTVVILIQTRLNRYQRQKNRCVAFFNHSKLGAVPIRYASISYKFVSSQAATLLFIDNRFVSAMSVVSPPSADDDYQHFVKDYHHINDEGNNRTTALSRKLDESQEMHELSDRLVDGRIIVNDIMAVMKNKKATKKSRDEALNHLQQS
jgi:hypothetical protein